MIGPVGKTWLRLGPTYALLNEHGVDYVLIGGYALYALGYQRGTVDIDLVLSPTRE